MAVSLNEVFESIRGERARIDAKWGTIESNPHEVGAWLTVIDRYAGLASSAWVDARGAEADAAACGEIRKIAAICCACLEQYGLGLLPPTRHPSDPGLPGIRQWVEAAARFGGEWRVYETGQHTLDVQNRSVSLLWLPAGAADPIRVPMR